MNREIDTPGNQCWDVVVYLVYREDQALDEENPLAWCRLAFKNPQKKYTVIGSENEDVPLGLEPSTFYEDDERDPRDILKNDGLGIIFECSPSWFSRNGNPKPWTCIANSLDNGRIRRLADSGLKGF